MFARSVFTLVCAALLLGAAQSSTTPSSLADLNTAETKWGHHGWGGGPGLGPLGRWGPGPFGPWGPYGGLRPGVERFAGGYGTGFFDDPLAAFAFRAFPGGVDPWGLGYGAFGPF